MTEFKERVTELVRNIPAGRVMTYGQIAALCGNPQAARIVGGIAHFGDPNIPWHRVVNREGRLASGYHGGRKSHAKDLATEGIIVRNEQIVNLGEVIWWPQK